MLTRDYPPKIGGIATHAAALVKHLEMLGVEVDVYPGYSDLRTLLEPITRSFKGYDLVHVQSSPYGAFVTKEPMVVTVHASVKTEMKYYTHLLKLKSFPAYLCEKSTLRKASTIIAVSDLTKRDLVENYGIDSAKVAVIPNGVEYEEFSSRRGNADSDQKDPDSYRIASILLVSRLEPRKNIEEALMVLSRLPKSEYKATIVGEGSEGARLERVSREKNANVRFLGRIERERLPEVYAQADIFLSTSYSEGFGLTILEAMASGCAVVASNIPTHRDLIEDGKNGILYDNASDLESKLKTLIADPDLVRKLASRGQETAKRFSWDYVATTVLKQYEICISSQNR